MMTKAIFLTAYDRPELLARTMRSWELVRGVLGVPFLVMIEPGPKAEECAAIVEASFVRMGHLASHVEVNPTRYGVLHHPWVGFEKMFKNFDFVIRAEDDLCVSDDVLEYFDWAEAAFRDDSEVATVHAYTDGPGSDPEVVQVLSEFNPWIWGTWKNVWHDVLGPTWDHDYSTFNGTPGNQSGWDWNLNTRIFPQLGLSGVFPEMSRVDNIGVYGIHGTAENFRTAESFRPLHARGGYRMKGRSSEV